MINGENGKKNEKTFTKRWNFSNLKTLIPFEYRPKWFCCNFEKSKKNSKELY